MSAEGTFRPASANAAAPSEIYGFLRPDEGQIIQFGIILGPSAYPTGGFAIPATLNRMMRHITGAVFNDNNGARLWAYNASTNKIQIFTALNTEAGNGTDQSGQSADVLLVGSQL